MGSVTGPHPHGPPTHSQWVVGPGSTPQRTSGRGWQSARPRTTHTQARGAPPERPPAAPTARKASSQERACGFGGGFPHPHPPHPQPVGSGPRPQAPKDERSEVGECPTLDAPCAGKRQPPRAPSCCPHSAQGQLARARAVCLVTGPHARTPRTLSQWVVGPGRTPQRTSSRGLGERPTPDAPHQGKRQPPPGLLVPPPQHARPARKSARCGVGCGPPCPHPPHPQPVSG